MKRIDTMIAGKRICQLFYLIAAFVVSLAAQNQFHWSNLNYAILLTFVLAYFLFSRTLPLGNRRARVGSLILSLIYTFLNSFSKAEQILSGAVPLPTLLLLCATTFLLILSALRFLFSVWENASLQKASPTQPTKRTLRRLFFLFMLLLLLAFLPFYLRDFPGVMVTDSINELKMIRGTLPWNDNHPLAHTMMIKILFGLGELLAPGYEHAGILSYSVAQMLLAAAIYSYALVTMIRFGVKRWFVVLSFCFFAFMPYHSTQSYIVWKDTPFGLCMLAYSVSIWRMIRIFKNGDPPGRSEGILLFLSAFGVCMLRHNGIAAILPPALILSVLYWKRSRLPAAVFAAVLLLFALYKGPLLTLLDLKSHDSVEALCIPLQQVSRAIVDGAVLTEEETALVEGLVDLQQIPLCYDPTVADPIKSLIRETPDYREYFEANKGAFLRLYLRLGRHYPASYCVAYVHQTIGYWYPDLNGIVLLTHILEPNETSLLSFPAWKALHGFCFRYLSVPFYGLLFSVGGILWVCLALLTVALVRKRYGACLVMLPSFCIVLTILAGTAVNSEMRYVYCLFTGLPIFAAAAFCGTEKVATGLDNDSEMH